MVELQFAKKFRSGAWQHRPASVRRFDGSLFSPHPVTMTSLVGLAGPARAEGEIDRREGIRCSEVQT